MATCERTPETISSTRAAIGWEIDSSTPGKVFNFSRIWFAISSWLKSRSPNGLSVTIGSDSKGWPGSAGDSPRPKRETTRSTPGTVMMRFIASNSSLMDSSKEILGDLAIKGVIEPSCITGINDLPSIVNATKLTSSKIMARFTTNFGLSKHQCSHLV